MTAVSFPPDPNAPGPLELSWAAFGDVIDAPAIDGRTEPYFVLHTCGLLVGKAFLCITCRRSLANLGQLEMHLEPGGRHHVVAWCPMHRTYEAPDPTQVGHLGVSGPGGLWPML
jgi:hypothetical protein